MNRIPRRLALLLLLASPVPAVAYRERLVVAVQAGRCALRLEADDEARALRIRVVPGDSRCRVAREAVQRLLAAAFSRAAAPRLVGRYSSLYLGRLVDYPWLSSFLASTAAEDARWDRRRGRPFAMGANAYVSTVLSARQVTAPLESAMERGGYRVRAVTVEKVLVGSFRDVPGHEGPAPPGKLPFDAMVWLRLEQGGPARPR